MEHSQKMTVAPFESEIPPNLPLVTDSNTEFSSVKKPKTHTVWDKLNRQLKIGLKLALINGFDIDLKIKDENGLKIYNSNLMNLLNEATTISKILLGYDEFIKLLYNANVEPELIVNENIKARLMNLYNQKTKSYQSNSINAVPVITSIKRQREQDSDDENIEPPSKKVPNWIVPGVENLPLPDNDDE